MTKIVKNEFLLGYNLTGWNFFRWGKTSKFSASGEDSPSYLSSRENSERGEWIFEKKMKRENRWRQKKFI